MAKDEFRETPNLQLPTEDIDTVKDTYTPEGFKTQEDYLKDLRKTYELDIEADDENRKAAVEDKRFVAGEQWDPIVLQQRQGLPCLTINTIPQFTAQLVGDWRENKNAVKVLPAEGGDKAIADIRSDLIRSIETRSRADRIYADAFESMIQCGDGAFRVGVQYASEDVFDQDIVIKPIDDALSVVWDRLSIDPTGKDANHCFVDDVMPRKEFDEQWPDTDPSELLSTRDFQDMSSCGWFDTQTVRVTEHWRMVERKRLLVMYEDGSIFAMDEKLSAKMDEYEQKHGKPVKSRIAPCSYAQMHLVTGFKILAGPYEYKLSRLPIIRMAGRTVSYGDRRIRYGIVRFIKDNARLRNFMRSVAAEQLGYAPKAQWLAVESAVEGREDAFRKAHLSRDPLLIYNDGAETPPERMPPPVIQDALLNEAQMNVQDMKDITGIHDASLGIKSNETSGRAIMARQREGDVASLTYYDNGNSALLEAGDVINQFIPQILDGTRIIRIIGEDEKTKLITINDDNDPNSPNLAVGKYDVAMSTGASYTTRRVEAAQAMMEAIQVYPELMGIAGDLVIKAQDWPGAEELSERMLKTVPPQLLSDKEKQERGDQPDFNALMQQQQQVGQQLQAAMQELQKLQQENFTLKTKADIESKKIDVETYKAETGRLEAYAALLKDNLSINLQQMETEAELALKGQAQDHQHVMQVADMIQDHNQFQQGQANQADLQQNQLDAQERQAAAQAPSSNGTQSTPASD